MAVFSLMENNHHVSLSILFIMKLFKLLKMANTVKNIKYALLNLFSSENKNWM